MYLVADGFQARPHPTCWGLEREFFAGKRSSWVLLSEGSLLYETFLVGLNACEQLGGWLVFWVLEDEFAAYGKVEGKLAEVVDGVGGLRRSDRSDAAGAGGGQQNEAAVSPMAVPGG